MTNLERIRAMSDQEMAKFIEAISCDYDSTGYIGCSHCSSWNSHHSDKNLIGTDKQYLYECGGCEFENGLVAWLNDEVKENE